MQQTRANTGLGGEFFILYLLGAEEKQFLTNSFVFLKNWRTSMGEVNSIIGIISKGSLDTTLGISLDSLLTNGWIL